MLHKNDYCNGSVKSLAKGKQKLIKGGKKKTANVKLSKKLLPLNNDEEISGPLWVNK